MEKRSNANKIVQQDIEQFAEKGELDQIRLRIQFFERLTQDQTMATSRRSGLYGLSIVAVGLYQKKK